MHRWSSYLSAMMLVLMLWTGGAAHAAEQFQCIPVSSEAANHFEGDSDQTSSDPGKNVAHHHSGCSGHHIAADVDASAVSFPHSAALIPLAWRQAGVPGRGPDADLRPPIA